MLLTDEDERIQYDALSECAFADIRRKDLEAFMLIPARCACEENKDPSKLWKNEEEYGRFVNLSGIVMLVYGPIISSTA